ncbi:NADP-dependent oxidoreductase domain-containing protein 1 [Bombina bombina]|uniref:NADP-dependent oxidoreductase domain-containing protein 1 n=1 Tax=Bombina bombina TaxID=8345 RepID=UPI00235AAB23|nr:NADP-dependent oxidoreductase domain-containing protein 1 [Bombina bombina]
MFGDTDITAGLSSLQFEHGVEPRHKGFLHLVQRSHLTALTVCAHSVFFCKLLLYVRHPEVKWCSLHTPPKLLQISHNEHLRVGIIGGGHLGKKLALCLTHLSGLHAEEIRISTRRPETLRELQELGVQCFYNNVALASWAQVLFLCCLPSQLPTVCAEIRNHLQESCIVYSLASAVPLPRLKQLLSHSSVIRLKYRYESKVNEQELDKKGTITAVLRDASVVKTLIPGDPEQGGVCVVSRWIESSVYAALNMCTFDHLSHQQSLNILNTLIQQLDSQEGKTSSPALIKEHFVIKDICSALSEDSSFPLVDLISVQTKDTPFSQHLASSPWLQKRFLQLFYTCFVGSLAEMNQTHLTLTSKDS